MFTCPLYLCRHHHIVYSKHFQTSQQSALTPLWLILPLQVVFKIFLPAWDALWFHCEVSRCGFVFVYAACSFKTTLFSSGTLSSVAYSLIHILSIFIFWYSYVYFGDSRHTYISIITITSFMQT